MPVSVSNLCQNPKTVKVISSGTNVQSRLAGIGMPMIVRRGGNAPEIMTVSAILGYKQISQISKRMSVTFH